MASRPILLMRLAIGPIDVIDHWTYPTNDVTGYWIYPTNDVVGIWPITT